MLDLDLYEEAINKMRCSKPSVFITFIIGCCLKVFKSIMFLTFFYFFLIEHKVSASKNEVCGPLPGLGREMRKALRHALPQVGSDCFGMFKHRFSSVYSMR